MVQRIKFWMRGWVMPILMLLIIAIWHLSTILPPSSYWMHVHSVYAFDTPKNADVAMVVDREIKRPFTAQWNVLVRRATLDGGWEIVCMARGGGDYRPDAVLPDPLTLDWWTDGQCPHPPAGQIMVSTVWDIPTGFPGNRTILSESNVFTVRSE